LEVYFIEDYKFNIKTNEKIMDYVNEFIKNKEHLKNYNNEILNFIKKRWFKTMKIFYDNLQQTCYSIILLRKSDILEEIELFTTQKI
jgi:hypothetical protein